MVFRIVLDQVKRLHTRYIFIKSVSKNVLNCVLYILRVKCQIFGQTGTLPYSFFLSEITIVGLENNSRPGASLSPLGSFHNSSFNIHFETVPTSAYPYHCDVSVATSPTWKHHLMIWNYPIYPLRKYKASKFQSILK